MSLVDLKSKHSILGENTPISDMNTNKGPQFANFRNYAYSTGPEPLQDPQSLLWDADWDSHLEKLLVESYTYNTSGETGDDVIVQPGGNSSTGGYLHYADLYQGIPPEQTFGTRGTHPYNGVDNGPSDGFYWLT